MAQILYMQVNVNTVSHFSTVGWSAPPRRPLESRQWQCALVARSKAEYPWERKSADKCQACKLGKQTSVSDLWY